MRDPLRRTWRLLPSLLVVTLVFAAATAMRTPPPPRAVATTPCDGTLLASPTNDQYPLAGSWGVTQPFDPTTNVQACSLRVYAAWNYDDVKLVAWDAIHNAPDASTVPLRYFTYDPSQLAVNHLQVDLGARPVVTQRLGHLADPPRTRLALDVVSTYPYGNAQYIYYDHDGDATTPIAYQYPAVSGTRVPIAGNHPVLSHGLCDGDAATQALVLAQSVMTANSVLDTTWYEVFQRFRVPATVNLEFVEFAEELSPAYPYSLPPSQLQIVDATSPSPDAAIPIAQAAFNSPAGLPQWVSHVDFDQPPGLTAERDYGLIVRGAHYYCLGARALTGSESSDFTDRIGTLYGRTSAGGPWVPIAGKALSLRVIGTPVAAVGVPQPPLAPGARLKLSITPNPSRGAVSATWSGGSGRARVDVLDARGRRIAGSALPDAGQGRWSWSGAAADGRVAPPGLYFLRVQDDAGHTAVERVVVVR